MMTGLLAIFGAYGLCVAALHALYHLHEGKRTELTRVVLVTKDNQQQIEWYMRSLRFFSWLRGRHITITVLDEGSTDDTLAIVRRLAGEDSDIRERTGRDALERLLEDHQEEPVLLVQLARWTEPGKLPTLTW